MKTFLYLLAGVSVALAYTIAKQKHQAAPAPIVDDLVHKLQDAWADHHTVA